jgi:DNA-binding response OmpR family regulator
MRLIIVSQDVAAISLLKTMLLKAAHNVEVFDCAERAHQANATNPADCILTDWLLPGMDGIELARRVKRDAGPPLIVMSELATPEARHHAMRAGAFAYVLKPLYPQSVVSAILAVRKTSAVRRAGVAREIFENRLMKEPVWTKYDVLVTEWLRGCTGTALDETLDKQFVPPTTTTWRRSR